METARLTSPHGPKWKVVDSCHGACVAVELVEHSAELLLSRRLVQTANVRNKAVQPTEPQHRRSERIIESSDR